MRTPPGPPPSRGRRGGRLAGALVVVAVLAGACARGETLGPPEAVEVMVLEGTDRGRAVCIVEALDGRMPLEKIAGLDVDLDANELTLLSTTSARCAPTVAGSLLSSGSGLPLSESEYAAQLAAAAGEVDVDVEVDRMVDEGLDPDVGQCLRTRVGALDAPGAVLTDVDELSRAVVDCRLDLAPEAGGADGAEPDPVNAG